MCSRTYHVVRTVAHRHDAHELIAALKKITFPDPVRFFMQFRSETIVEMYDLTDPNEQIFTWMPGYLVAFAI